MPLPGAVAIREVGPRDGLQNEREILPTADKVALVDALARTGLRRIEVTSFVRPDVIPQLGDAAEVLEAVDVPAGVSRSVLIPNERGLDLALAHRERFDEVNVFVSATDAHNRVNVRRTVSESLEGLRRVLRRAREAGLHCEAVVVVAFVCPYEGVVPVARALDVARALADAGAHEVAFGDTIGAADPVHVARLFGEAASALPAVELTAHFHNTRGQALANVLAALQAGCASFESSIGELGGSPLTPGATGNLATEDLVFLLQRMGVATGVSLDALLDVAREAERMLGRPLPSHTLRAGALSLP